MCVCATAKKKTARKSGKKAEKKRKKSGLKVGTQSLKNRTRSVRKKSGRDKTAPKAEKTRKHKSGKKAENKKRIKSAFFPLFVCGKKAHFFRFLFAEKKRFFCLRKNSAFCVENKRAPKLKLGPKQRVLVCTIFPALAEEWEHTAWGCYPLLQPRRGMGAHSLGMLPTAPAPQPNICFPFHNLRESGICVFIV